jgi:hypothetical protein
MVMSSFSPVPGAEANDELERLRRDLPVPLETGSKRVSVRASQGFSHYVSSRTVLAGGCPAVNGEAVARASRRIRTSWS